MLKGFRDFILRGNVVDLAVAVIIGAAFAAITNSLVTDIINPFIAAIVGKPDFSAIVWHLSFHPSVAGKPDATAGVIQIGKFLNNVIAFVLNAAVVYFVIVLPVQKLLAHINKPAPAGPPTTKVCAQCLSEIPLAATRCKFCTQPVETAAVAI
jgi:large conductance mechanosensitive channel